MTSWTVRVRTPTLALTDPVEFSSATLVENYLGVDMLSLEGRTKRMGAAMIPGNGIYVVDGSGRRRFSGDLLEVERRGDGTCTLMFVGDDFFLRSDICYPNPANAWSTAGQSAAYDVRTAPAESRVLAYVNANVGPGARSERRVPRLRVPASGNRGPSAKSSARFQVVADFIAPLAESAGLDIGVKQTFDGLTPWLDVTVTEAPDMSGFIRFGTASASGPAILGQDWSYKLTRYTANVALCAAEGEKGARTLSQLDRSGSDDSVVWGGRRIVKFVDQRGSEDATETAKAVAEDLDSAASVAEVAVPITSTPTFQLGVDAPLGARVSAVLDGIQIKERIRQITTVVSNDGPTEKVSAIFGSPDAGPQSPTQKALKAALKRLEKLEKI